MSAARTGAVQRAGCVAPGCGCATCPCCATSTPRTTPTRVAADRPARTVRRRPRPADPGRRAMTARPITAARHADHRSPPWARRPLRRRPAHAATARSSCAAATAGCCPLEVERWCAARTPPTCTVLRRCEGAVLDIGCGAGRLVAALAARGRRALPASTSARPRSPAPCGRAAPPCAAPSSTRSRRGPLGHRAAPRRQHRHRRRPRRVLLRRTAEVLAVTGSLIVECAQAEGGAYVDERCEVRVADGRGGLVLRSPGPWRRPAAWARHAVAADWVRLAVDGGGPGLHRADARGRGPVDRCPCGPPSVRSAVSAVRRRRP